MKTVSINIYEYDELKDDAKGKVINDVITFFLEIFLYDEMPKTMQEAINDVERLHTPWFTKQAIYEKCKDILLEEARMHHYYFDGDKFQGC